MKRTEPLARPMPTQLTSGVLAADQAFGRLEGDVGGEQEELHGDEPLRPLLGSTGEDTMSRETPRR
jgi:hypothetical protein